MRYPSSLLGLFLITFGAAGCGGSDSPEMCSNIGCTAGGTYSATLTIPQPESDLIAVTACRNAVCGTTLIQLGKSSSTQTPPTSGPGVEFYFPGGAGPQPVSIKVQGQNADLKDGDVYRLTVEDRTSKTTLLDVTTKPATYTKVQPNGAACDKGFHCLQATLASAP